MVFQADRIPFVDRRTGRLRFHDPAKEKTRMCPRRPNCKFFLRNDCWFAHSEEEIRCPAYARDGHCPMPRVSLNPVRCPQGLHERGTGQIFEYTQESTPMDREKKSWGNKPPTSVLNYVKPLFMYPLPDALAAMIAQRKEDLDDAVKRRKFIVALHATLNAIIASPTTTLTRDNYKTIVPALLFVDEAQKLNDMRRYDIKGAELEQSVQNGLWKVVVPSLAEKRPSVLRGDEIVLHDTGLDRVHTGYVHFVNLDHVMVSFDDSEEYSAGPYNIYFKMGRTQWRTQHRAVEDAPVFLDEAMARPLALPSAGHLAAVRPILSELTKNLTSDQKSFIDQAIGQPRGLHILWGPPGTGKTTTLVAAIRAITMTSPKARVLVVAPSNAAVDVVTERLIASCGPRAPKIVRVHSLSRAHKDVSDVVKSVSMPNRRTGGFDFPSATSLSVEGIVVLSTLSTSARIDSIGCKSFDFILVDEAGQATEGELLLPLTLARPAQTRVLVAGDHKQLGPIVPPALNRYEAARSPLVRLMNCSGCRDAVTLLRENFRSVPAIVDVFNPTYDNKLVCRHLAPASAHQQYVDRLWRHLERYTTQANMHQPTPREPGFRSTVFVHVCGEESREPDSPSWMNLAEAGVAVDALKALAPTKATDVALLAPYTQQVKKLEQKIHYEYTTANTLAVKPVASSVEMYQGKEAPVVILNAVRSVKVEEMEGDLKRHLGFLSQPQRLNVAVSRPQALLVIVGNANLLVQDSEWRRMIMLLWGRGCVRNNSSYRNPCADPTLPPKQMLAQLRLKAQQEGAIDEVTADEIVYANNRD